MTKQKEKIIKLGCKFCHYNFSVLDQREYINHLWRFHRDNIEKQLNEVSEEIRRIEKLPK